MEEMRLSVAEIITVLLAVVAIATFGLSVWRERRTDQTSQSTAAASAARNETKLDIVSSDVRSTKEGIDKLYGKLDAMRDDIRGLDTRLVKVETTCEGLGQRITNIEKGN